MKKLVLLLTLAILLTGCSGVILSSQYSRLLDQTQALSAETAQRAHDGKLTPAEMAEALACQAIIWQRFCNARDNIHDERLAAPTTQPTALLDLVPIPEE